MDTTCDPLVTDLFLLCYKRDFMLSLLKDNQPDGGIEGFNFTSRYLDTYKPSAIISFLTWSTVFNIQNFS